MMARTLGVTAPALNRWARRQQTASDGTDQRGRPPVIPAAAVEKIRSCYLAHYGQWGPQVLRAWCQRQELGSWSATTIAAVIADLRKPPPPSAPAIRYEVTAPDVMWSEDGTGFKQRGRKQELLVVQDECSRLKLHWQLAAGPAQAVDVHRYLSEAFALYGAPLVLKHDGDGIFHTPQVKDLLDCHGVVELTAPRRWPQYNGKQERSMRDIKSYERALRRHGVGKNLASRLNMAMYDLNEERPRPVLGGKTAREAYNESNIPLPDRRLFRVAVDAKAAELQDKARSRKEKQSARRRAIQEVLLGYGLMEMVSDVSHDLSSDSGTE
jgi:transposase InsO family protein